MINKQDWTAYKRLLFMQASGGSASEYTATGNPLSFNTNLAKPLKSLTIPFTPTQSGTGDPSPTNVRPISGVSAVNVWQTGKNLYNYDGDNIKQETTSASTTRAVYHTGLKNGTYTLSGSLKEGQTAVAYGVNLGKFKNNVATLSSTFITTVSVETRTITVGSDEEIVFMNPSEVITDLQNKLVRYDLQIELGETATPYTPYTGQSFNITFPALGKNLLNEYGTIYNKTISSTNGWVNSDDAKCITAKLKPNTTYYAKAFTSVSIFRACTFNVDPSTITTNYYPIVQYISNNTTEFSFTTGNNDIWVAIQANGSYVSAHTAQIMLVEGSTAPSTYEPYTNTVYGGSLDVTTGVLTVTCKGKVYNGSQSEEWAVTGSGNYACKQDDCKKDERNIIPLCDKFEMEQTYASAYPIRPVDSKDYASDVTEWKTWLASNPIQVVYILATPITYQLTPQQITSLLGDNTIWSDTNGSNSAVYLKKG